MPSKNWSHPTLGAFQFNGYAWNKTVSLPAFKACSYDTGNKNAQRSKGKHELSFVTESESDIPSAAAVSLADKVLANQEPLVAAVTKALWLDFNGKGPNTGMWWHGDLDAVMEGIEDVAMPTGPDDLLPLLQLSGVFVREGVDDYEKPIVELSFRAPFEEEHGVALLTDGKAILGIGYSADASLFKPDKKKRR